MRLVSWEVVQVNKKIHFIYITAMHRYNNINLNFKWSGTLSFHVSSDERPSVRTLGEVYRCVCGPKALLRSLHRVLPKRFLARHPGKRRRPVGLHVQDVTDAWHREGKCRVLPKPSMCREARDALPSWLRPCWEPWWGWCWWWWWWWPSLYSERLGGRAV